MSILLSPIHAKDFPFRCLDWDHSEDRFQAIIESAKERHSIVIYRIVDGKVFFGNEVIDDDTLWH